MSLICNLFGCRKFKYHTKAMRECIRCHTIEYYVDYYPGLGCTWLEEDFLKAWPSYKILKEIGENRPAECCGRAEKDCRCLVC